MDLATENSYPTPFANTVILPLLLTSLAQQKHAPQTTSEFKNEYDYVIVGGGSAGSVLASRLSEVPCISVLLLEAGKAAPRLTEVPLLARTFWFTDVDWSYKTVPQKHTGFGLVNNEVIWPSGKALGGSSIINAQINVRGNHWDYDEWSRQGAIGWNYSEVLPYFLKMEDQTDPNYLGNGFHRAGGPVSVQTPPYSPEIKLGILEAAKELNRKVIDPNGPTQTGYYVVQGTLRNGQRCSAAKAYLVPADDRRNLDILPNAFVEKIVIRNQRAVGVKFEHGGKTHQVRAKREVILSAGTTNSAQLLMLSGIGPKEHLESFNIPVVADLPVGNNLQDHCSALLVFQLDANIKGILQKAQEEKNFLAYLEERTGPLTSLEGCSMVVFGNGEGEKDSQNDLPIFQLFLAEFDFEIIKYQMGIKEEIYQKMFTPFENATSFICLTQNLRPKSRGTVRLQSTNPHDPPLIDPNYFDDPRDFRDIVEGLRECFKIGTSQALRKFGSKVLPTLIPGCDNLAANSDAYFECLARQVVVTMSHQTGTCKMGDPNDPTTVVDPSLRVKNVRGLRVVDASVMPNVPSGNTNVPTMMLAEKASDIIKRTIRSRIRTRYRNGPRRTK